MPRDASNSPGARALRLAGYVKLPAWWVTQEQLLLILKLWPVGITIRHGEPPTEITNWPECNDP